MFLQNQGILPVVDGALVGCVVCRVVPLLVVEDGTSRQVKSVRNQGRSTTAE